MQNHPMSQNAHERQQREREQQSTDPSKKSSALALDLAVIKKLAASKPAVTVSIYLPTHRTGSDRQQDHIRAKNLLHDAKRMLGQAADGGPAIAMMNQVIAEIEHDDFWAHPSEGLALFFSEGIFHHVWVPATMPELVLVGEHFHIKPLIPVLQGDGRFYLLDLTQHGVRLFSGSRFGLEQVELAGAPTSLDDALGHPDAERHSGVRLINAAGQGSSRNFSTVGDEHAKERIQRYFQYIDSAICTLLHAEQTPLVTSGVEYLSPLYREVNHYPHLMKTGIPGHPDAQNSTALHDQAWEVVAPIFNKAASDALERYAQLRDSARASHDLGEVLTAAVQGRVDDLFVAGDAECWGSYDPLDNNLQVHDPRGVNDDDLLNYALISALSSQARVQVLPRAEMPDQNVIAAVFRY